VTVAVEVAVRAQGPEVVRGDDERPAEVPEPRAAVVRKEVVDVHDVRIERLDLATRRTTDAGRDGHGTTQRVEWLARHVVVVHGDERDVQAGAAERGRLGFDDGVLPARRLGAVEVVDERDLHARPRSVTARRYDWRRS
jgi:hypothetical protein